MSYLISELEQIHVDLQKLLESAGRDEVLAPIDRLEESAHAIGKAWSGSWLGYHSRVYYQNLQPPPPGARFSSEWGLMDAFSMGSTGQWQEPDVDRVRDAIERKAGNPPLESARAIATDASKVLDDSREHVLSILETWLARHKDPFLERLRDETQEQKRVTASDFVAYMRPKGQWNGCYPEPDYRLCRPRQDRCPCGRAS